MARKSITPDLKIKVPASDKVRSRSKQQQRSLDDKVEAHRKTRGPTLDDKVEVLRIALEDSQKQVKDREKKISALIAEKMRSEELKATRDAVATGLMHDDYEPKPEPPPRVRYELLANYQLMSLTGRLYRAHNDPNSNALLQIDLPIDGRVTVIAMEPSDAMVLRELLGKLIDNAIFGQVVPPRKDTNVNAPT